jgi:hypothetical protein
LQLADVSLVIANMASVALGRSKTFGQSGRTICQVWTTSQSRLTVSTAEWSM